MIAGLKRLASPVEPEDGVVDLRLPDLPGVKATLKVELVWQKQVVEFGCKLPGIRIVGLIFGGSANIHL
jgi:hypothetical protein